MLDAVLVAGDQRATDAAVEGVLPLVVGLAGVRVEPLDDLLGDARVVAEPDRAGDDEDVGCLDPRPQLPLSGGKEFTEPDFEMGGSNNQPIIATDAHVRIVHPDANDGARMLRRGYNFVDGSDPLGGLDAGLFFIAYVRDPRTHFIPAQLAMASQDALMEYLKFTSSAIFAVPPGVRPGEYVGQPLFA